jgi:hypothetical protein
MTKHNDLCVNFYTFHEDILREIDEFGVTSRGYLTAFNIFILKTWGCDVEEIKDGFGETAHYRICASKDV